MRKGQSECLHNRQGKSKKAREAGIEDKDYLMLSTRNLDFQWNKRMTPGNISDYHPLVLANEPPIA